MWKSKKPINYKDEESDCQKIAQVERVQPGSKKIASKGKDAAY
jgi:hypothetical protein